MEVLVERTKVEVERRLVEVERSSGYQSVQW
jgi:hypothetical protein